MVIGMFSILLGVQDTLRMENLSKKSITIISSQSLENY